MSSVVFSSLFSSYYLLWLFRVLFFGYSSVSHGYLWFRVQVNVQQTHLGLKPTYK